MSPTEFHLIVIVGAIGAFALVLLFVCCLCIIARAGDLQAKRSAEVRDA